MAAGQSESFQPNMNVEQGQVPRRRTRHDFLVADTNTEKVIWSRFLFKTAA